MQVHSNHETLHANKKSLGMATDTEARNHPGRLPAILLLSFANLYTVLHDGC